MPRRLLRSIAAIILTAVTTIVLIAVIRGLETSATRPVREAGDQFMIALKYHDMTTAFDMLSAELQGKIGQTAFMDIFAEADVADWSFISLSMEKGVGSLIGQATIDQQNYKVELRFTQGDGQWQLMDYHFDR